MSFGYYNVSFLESVKNLIFLAEVLSKRHHDTPYGIVRLEQVNRPLAGTLLLENGGVRDHDVRHH